NQAAKRVLHDRSRWQNFSPAPAPLNRGDGASVSEYSVFVKTVPPARTTRERWSHAAWAVTGVLRRCSVRWAARSRRRGHSLRPQRTVDHDVQLPRVQLTRPAFPVHEE